MFQKISSIGKFCIRGGLEVEVGIISLFPREFVVSQDRRTS